MFSRPCVRLLFYTLRAFRVSFPLDPPLEIPPAPELFEARDLLHSPYSVSAATGECVLEVIGKRSALTIPFHMLDSASICGGGGVTQSVQIQPNQTIPFHETPWPYQGQQEFRVLCRAFLYNFYVFTLGEVTRSKSADFGWH